MAHSAEPPDAAPAGFGASYRHGLLGAQIALFSRSPAAALRAARGEEEVRGEVEQLIADREPGPPDKR